MEENKTQRDESLLYTQKNGYDTLDAAGREAMHTYCEAYKRYLDASRTEREAVNEAIRLAEEKGFVAYEPGMLLSPGSKIYSNNRGKALMLAVLGEETLDKGAVVAAAHVDSPRLDLKQLPLFEDSELCFFKTHYYGGIKKYQWLTLPLALHGTVVRRDGSVLDVAIGDKPEDPQFVITDLLPHLGKDQMKKPMAEVVSGEGLNLLIGSVPYGDAGSDRVKYAVLCLLHEKYGITEEDFLSAELCAVPALPSRDQGFDRSLIGGYGHDDRVCAFAELQAILELERPRRTAVCILADKEEIGSDGVTGMQSAAFEHFMSQLCRSQEVCLDDCFAASFCLSADVCNGYDPNFPEVSEKRNNAKLNYGMGICKYTGARGKSGTNDASAETVGYLRRVFAEKGVVWQMAELGKVDQGGGGTVAKFMGNRNIETIDAGVPVLSMHAPYETVAKFDCYMTYLGVKALYED